ncbi:MAG: peptidase T [Oscillospiraceae bacterium]|nr:peptidase T [Oscillospiraceae bacterium]
MYDVKERFLRYVAIDTQSAEESDTVPSTLRQLDLARLLRDELKEMGACGVQLDEHGYVTARIPANTGEKRPVLGLIAHVDTSDAVSGADVRPVVTPDYDGGDIAMGPGYTLSPKEFPDLLKHKGQEIICTDGSTLLGADDKAGVAEIMAAAKLLLAPDAPAHGDVRICFTPDEEVGGGAAYFDVAGFGADFAYTVDGGELGEINFENFNAANAVLTVRGTSIHPGSAKGKMVSAALVAMEFQSLLPAHMDPSCTEKYEGFYHLTQLTASVDTARAVYIIRDHDRALFEQKKRFFMRAADFLNEKYGAGTVTAELTDTYSNMREKIDPKLVELAAGAMRACGVEPIVRPIRGGTDGATLSYKGLPCPNLSTGGYNFHGRYEFIPTEAMEKMTEILVRIAAVVR